MLGETSLRHQVLALLAFHGYLAQAILGGLTVHFFLKASVYHAVLAQAVFGLLVALTFLLSRPEEPGPRVPRPAVVLVAAIYVQIFLGALVRHHDAALAMPSFPLPLVPEAFSAQTTLHFIHRLGALGVLAAAARSLPLAFRRRDMVGPAVLTAVLILAQILLGASIVWTKRVDHVATGHVAVGSLLVAASLILALRARERQPAPILTEKEAAIRRS
jgi:heme A synthase